MCSQFKCENNGNVSSSLYFEKNRQENKPKSCRPFVHLSTYLYFFSILR